jgi:hypothetical protein
MFLARSTLGPCAALLLASTHCGGLAADLGAAGGEGGTDDGPRQGRTSLDASDAANGVAVVTLASNTSANCVAANASHVYWGAREGFRRSRVWSVAVGGGLPRLVADEQSDPISIALDEHDVVWVNAEYGTVVYAPLMGGTPTTLFESTTGASFVGVALDGPNVYWGSVNVGGVSILRRSRAGGDVVTIASTGGCAEGFTIDKTSVYWLSSRCGGSYSGDLLKIAKMGGPASTLATGDFGTGSFQDIVVRDDNVYWTTNRGTNTLNAVATTGGFVRELTSTSEASYLGPVVAIPAGILITSSRLGAGATTQIVEVSTDGHGVRSAASTIGVATGLAVWGRDVYVSAFTWSGGGSISRITLP